MMKYYGTFFLAIVLVLIFVVVFGQVKGISEMAAQSIKEDLSYQSDFSLFTEEEYATLSDADKAILAECNSLTNSLF